MNLRFRPRWRGTEIWMHSGEPLSGYLARPPYLQVLAQSGAGTEPERPAALSASAMTGSAVPGARVATSYSHGA